MLRPAVAAKTGDALMIPGLEEIAGSEEISTLEDAGVEIMAGLKDVLSILSDGFSGEQAESRLNSLELAVKLVVNALGIDTVSRLINPGDM